MQYRKYTDYKPYDNIKELYKKRIENAKYIFDTYYDKFEYRIVPFVVAIILEMIKNFWSVMKSASVTSAILIMLIPSQIKKY